MLGVCRSGGNFQTGVSDTKNRGCRGSPWVDGFVGVAEGRRNTGGPVEMILLQESFAWSEQWMWLGRAEDKRGFLGF